MLIRKKVLDQIKSGIVKLAFRRWRRLMVKAGSHLKTSVGVLLIQNIERVSERHISDRDAHRSGYSNRKELIEDLASREGNVYKIAIKYAGEDPRIRLRQNARLNDPELAEVGERLRRLDSHSKLGPWTFRLLTVIKKHPLLSAVEIASKTKFEKEWLKSNVRKLKNLGLTESYNPGYALSPRGKVVVAYLKKWPRSD